MIAALASIVFAAVAVASALTIIDAGLRARNFLARPCRDTREQPRAVQGGAGEYE